MYKTTFVKVINELATNIKKHRPWQNQEYF